MTTDVLRRPIVIGLVVGAVIVFGWWQMLWQPQATALADARHKEQVESSNLYQAGQRLGHLKHLGAISPQMAALDQKISAAVPRTDDLDGFLLALNGAAAQAGVALQAVSPSAQAPHLTGLTSIAVNLSVSGSYFSVQSFLDALRAGDRLVVVDSLSESPGGTDPKAGDVVASVGVHLLTGLAPSSVPPGPQAAPSARGTTSTNGSSASSAGGGPATTAPTATVPNGVISGPVGKARSAVTALNNASAQTDAATGGGGH